MSEKNHDMENNIGMSAKHGMQLPSRISNGGGAEEFQHRTVAHHRDVHDFDVSFYRP